MMMMRDGVPTNGDGFYDDSRKTGGSFKSPTFTIEGLANKPPQSSVELCN